MVNLLLFCDVLIIYDKMLIILDFFNFAFTFKFYILFFIFYNF